MSSPLVSLAARRQGTGQFVFKPLINSHAQAGALRTAAHRAMCVRMAAKNQSPDVRNQDEIDIHVVRQKVLPVVVNQQRGEQRAVGRNHFQFSGGCES